ERATGRRWNNDPLTAQAVREQVERLIGHFAPASAEPLVVPAEISKIVSELIVTLEFLATPGVPALEAFGDQEEFERLIADPGSAISRSRSEEHTSELQSLTNIVCRLLLEKKK